MRPKPVPPTSLDADKTREQLLSELQELRAQVAFQREAEVKSKSIAEALRESEARFREMADGAPVLIWVNGLEGCEFVNRAYLKFLGVREEVDVRHFDWAQFVHPDDREGYLNRYLNCFRRKVPFEAQFRFRRHDGVYRWMISVGQQRFTSGGEFLGYVGSTADINDIKEMKALRKSKLMLAKSQEIAHLGSWELDLLTNNLSWSDEVYRIFGLQPQEFGATYEAFLESVHPEDRAAVDAAYSGSIREGRDTYEIEHRVVKRSNGEFRIVHEKCEHFRDASGRVIRSVGMVHDITERKRAEEAIIRSEQMLQLVMDNIPQAIFWKDRNSTYLGCNKIFAKATGLGTPGDIPGKTDYDLPWSREQTDSFREYDRKVMENDTLEYHIVEQQREASGRIAWVETNKVLLHDAKGNVTGILGTYEDITERKLAEDALRKSEAMLRQIIDTSPIPMVVYREEKNYHINKKFIEAFGYTKEDIPSIDEWWPLAYPDKSYCEFVKNRWYAAVDDAIKNKTSIAPQEVTVTCKDGSKKDVLAFFSSIGDMNLAILQDITERKLAEEALRTTMQRFYTILEGMRASVLLVTEDSRIEFANQAFADYFELGESPADLIGLTSSEMIEKIQKVYRNSVESVARIREIVERKQPVIGEEIALRGGRTCLWDYLPLYIGGKLYGRLWLHLDITDRKQAEVELAEAKQQAELYLDLMGHDINNMHQIALGYLELARDMQADSEHTKFLDTPIEVLQRSAKLISNVRKLQKLHDGMFQGRDVDVCKVLSDVQRAFGAVPGKTIKLSLNGFERCHVCANELLDDVFSNLVGNAVKHTGGRAAIIVDLDVVENDGGRYCRVMVEDDGPGIPDDFKGVIFNRALKGTAKAKGMGLGLYLVKSLVDSYGGRVWVEDRIKGDHTKGARFVVILPALEK